MDNSNSQAMSQKQPRTHLRTWPEAIRRLRYSVRVKSLTLLNVREHDF